jgi:hypothetical protein
MVKAHYGHRKIRFTYNKISVVKRELTSKKPYLCPPCQKMPTQAAGE